MFKMSRFVYLLVFLSATAASAQQGQSKEELQRKTQQLLQEIEGVKQDLAETQKNKKQNLGVLRSIERKMDIRDQIIRNIKGEVYLVEKDIIGTYRDIDTLKRELATLKEQYAQSIVYAYKNRSNYDFLNFLFSANSFSDALKRVSYLKTYRSFREQKAGDIISTQKLLEDKIATLSGKRKEKAEALVLESKQMNELEQEKKEKDKVIAAISSQEKELRRTLANREKERKQIQNAIAAVIKREKEEAIRREREEAARRKAAETAANKTSGATGSATAPTKLPPANPVPVKKREASAFENTPEGLISSQQFEGNKGQLPWPVDKAIITLHHGINKIPTNNRPLEIPNDGVTMETTIGAAVKAIFDGEVRSVFSVGDRQSVMVSHGKYFTVYSNLSGVSVTKGQKVTTGQLLGKAGANDDGVGEVNLQVETERGSLNPEQWLRRK
jgi:septal ring factor EnvC (AmiA/AmiB activator)